MEDVTHKAVTSNAYNISVGKRDRGQFDILGPDRRVILEWGSCRCKFEELGKFRSGHCHAAISCEHSNKHFKTNLTS
jgi:hypothetical protein